MTADGWTHDGSCSLRMLIVEVLYPRAAACASGLCQGKAARLIRVQRSPRYDPSLVRNMFTCCSKSPARSRLRSSCSP